MSDTMFRTATLLVLVPGTVLAIARLLGLGPTWLLAVSQVLIVAGLVGTVALRRRMAGPGSPRGAGS